MKHQRHFGSSSGAAFREAVQIRTLMSDLDRIVRILDCDIAAEEEHAKVFDRSQAEYPMLARQLTARRDNLRNTIAALEARLATIAHPRFESARLNVPRNGEIVAAEATRRAGVSVG